MMKNNKTKDVVIYVILGLIGAAALACIIISMVTDRTTPFLGMGLALGCLGNAIGLVTVQKKKGYDNGSCKDGRVS